MSDADVQEIKLLVALRSDIKKPIYRITGFSASRAEVYSRRGEHAGDVSNYFSVRKRDGRWVVASSINEERIIVTGN